MNGTSCLLMPCSFIIDDKVMVFIQCKTRYSYVRRKAGINLLCFERELNNYTKIADMIMTTRKQEYKNMLELSIRKNGCSLYWLISSFLKREKLPLIPLLPPFFFFLMRANKTTKRSVRFIYKFKKKNYTTML